MEILSEFADQYIWMCWLVLHKAVTPFEINVTISKKRINEC